MNPHNFYGQQLQQKTAHKLALEQKIRLNGWMRLLSFASIIASFLFLRKIEVWLGAAASFALLVFFLGLVKRHINLKGQLNHVKVYIRLCEEEIKALQGDIEGFRDGLGYLPDDHPFAYDLDIVGKQSVLQMLNRTVTRNGEGILVDELLHPATDADSILETQKALQELAKLPDRMLDFRSRGSLVEAGDTDEHDLLEWSHKQGPFKHLVFVGYVCKMLPGALLASLLAGIFFPYFFNWAVFIFLLNLGITGARLKVINTYYHASSKQLATLKKYESLFRAVEEYPASSHLITGLQQALQTHHQKPSESLLQLKRIIAQFDSRLNIVVAIILEGVFLWDYQMVLRIEKWKEQHNLALEKWFEAVARFDNLVSKATYSYNFPGLKYPRLDKTVVLEAKQLGHPMIHPSERVDNDFTVEQDGKFVIITGANMAGKSTFLRTVGVSLVMAMNGLPVAAESYRFKPCGLFTSMRTNDSLARHESYFYAELLRLKHLLEALGQQQQMFIILDEILKGTNSTDKQKGSRAFMEKILALNGTGIIATHDLSLTNIEDEYPDKIKNQCFEIEIERAQIHFDYTLRPGVTQKMNAMLLMEQMGII